MLFDGGFLMMEPTKERVYLPNGCVMAMLVDGGATEHLVHDELQVNPGLKDRMRDYFLLNNRRQSWPPATGELRGTATRILCGTIVHQPGKKRDVWFLRLKKSDLGRHVFSSSFELKMILEEGSPHSRKGSYVVPLQHREKQLGLVSFRVEIDASSRASSPGIGEAPLLGIPGASSPEVAKELNPGVAGVAAAKHLHLGSQHRLRSTQYNHPRPLDHHHMGSSEHHPFLSTIARGRRSTVA